MSKVLTLLILVGLSSCISVRRLAKLCPVIIKDSISITTEYKDSIIYLTDHKVEYRDTLICDSAGIIKDFKKTFKSNGVKGSVSIINNKLTAICEVDSLKLVIKGLNKTIFHLQKETKIIPKLCQHKHRNKFDGFTFWWFIITASLVVIYIGKKFFMTKI